MNKDISMLTCPECKKFSFAVINTTNGLKMQCMNCSQVITFEIPLPYPINLHPDCMVTIEKLVERGIIADTKTEARKCNT